MILTLDSIFYMLGNVSIVVTILGVPTIIILYFNIGKKITTLFNNKKEEYKSKRLRGVIRFDYSNNNGKYTIGYNEQLFEIEFSKASDTSIHIYKDPPSIKGIALVKNKKDISEIKDASKYDMSSRTRTPQLGQIVILQNIHSNYCAIKILSIRDDTRGSEDDEVSFEYVINTDGYTDFSN